MQFFGAVIVAGLAVFAAHLWWMIRTPAPKPRTAPRIDFAVLHAAAAGASLAAAAGIGVTLLVLPTSTWTLHAATAYGVFGLVGFLGQMVMAVEVRLLPLFAWYWAYARGGFRIAPSPPLTMRDPMLQAVVFVGWTIAVPALSAGFALESPLWLAVGAWSLFAAVTVATLDNVFVLLHVVRQAPQRDQGQDDQIREQQGRHRRRAGEDLLEQRPAGLSEIRSGVKNETRHADGRLQQQYGSAQL